MTVTWTGGPVYGVSWGKTSSAVCTRLADSGASGQNWAPGTGGVAYANAVSPWKDMRRVNLWDTGEVTAVHGEQCFTDDHVADMGQVMVEIPKFYYYTEDYGGSRYWFITTDPAATVNVGSGSHTFKIHPAFNRGGTTLYNGTPNKDYVYVGAYEAYANGVKLESRAGVLPTTNLTRASFRTFAELRAGYYPAVRNHWEILDFVTLSAVQLLYLIEYANLNSQSMISAGATYNLQVETHRVLPIRTGWTGNCDNYDFHSPTDYAVDLGNASGQNLLYTSTNDGLNSADTTQATYASSYRGIENLWGNAWTIIDGINVQSMAVWIANHDFANSNITTHPYLNSGVTLSEMNDYMTDISYVTGNTTSAMDFGFLGGTASSGTSTTYFCDTTQATNVANYSVLWYGGYWASTATAGVFRNAIWANDESYVAPTVGARLMYIP